MSGLAATVSPVKRELRLLVQNLTGNDLAKVGAFLRIGRERLQCDWHVVFDGEFHVLMRGTEAPGTTDSPLATLCVADAGTGRHDAVEPLSRPLQYEALIEALSALEDRFAGMSAAHAVPGGLPPDARFRLRRWPPAELLQGNRERQRLASFLLTRLVGLDELARLSNVGKLQCEELLAVLTTTGILDVTTAAAAVPVASAASTALAQPATRSSPRAVHSHPDTGLFDTIRRGLGLTWQR